MGCAGAPPPVEQSAPPSAACSAASARIAFDFETAPQSKCVIEGERAFSIIVTPEHAPPINPSPWYAFRYQSAGEQPITVRLRYLGGKHRYRPLLTMDGKHRWLDAEVADDGKSATIELSPGSGIVSGQEIFDSARYRALAERLSTRGAARTFSIGSSLDGRDIVALRMGRPDAPRLVVLLGRRHPPEVTGALAMEPFLEALADGFVRKRPDLADVQVIAVPLLNPDGVARGHWRANRGGTDLNRDWGLFTQPETRAVARWLERLPDRIRPVAMIDFHSTTRNLFYVQGDEANEDQQRFLARWLAGKEDAIPGYRFTIERRNANPGAGTAKNWFHATFAIPAYTYEVGDDTDRGAIARAASELATDFLAALRSAPK